MSITKIREVFSLPNVHYAYFDDYQVTIKDTDPTFDHQAVYSFTQTANAIEDSYSGEFNFEVKWIRGDGTIKNETKKVVLKRNVMTTLKIVVKKPTPSSVAIEEESSEMTNENVDWTI